MTAESGRTGAVVMMRAQQRFASWAADEFVDTLASLLASSRGTTSLPRRAHSF